MRGRCANLRLQENLLRWKPYGNNGHITCIKRNEIHLSKPINDIYNIGYGYNVLLLILPITNSIIPINPVYKKVHYIVYKASTI